MATLRPLEGGQLRRWLFIGVSAALCGAGLVIFAGCEEDPFADAPSATAPPASEAESARAQEPQRRGGMRGEMPADHPPVGSSDEAAMPGSSAQAGTRRDRRVKRPSRGDLPLKWKAPSSWTSVEPASSMRLAQYRVPGPQGAQPATLAVFHFGSQGGGGVKANIERWVGQFKNPDGGAPDATIKKATIDGMTVHRVDVSGTFSAGRGMGSGKPKPNYRMLAAITDTPAGLFFFKMVGPQSTLADQTEPFESFVSSFRFER